jgi:hypothetical protein
MAVSGAQDVEDLINKIASATDFAIARLDNFIEGWKILKTILNSSLGDFKKNIQDVQVEEFNRRLKRDYMKVWSNVNIPGSAKQTAAEKAAEAAAKKRAADLVKATAKNTAELKKQTALKKAGTVFDLEQIQLVAALKGKLSENEKLRVEAQLALLNGNEAVATKLTNQILAAQDASGNLAKFLAALPNAKNPFEYLDAYLSYLANKAAAVLTGNPSPSAPSTGSTVVPPVTPPSTNVPTMPSDGTITYNPNTGLNYNPNANNVVVELKITGDGDLTNTIAKNLMQQSLSSGNQTYVNRRTGGFE